MRVPSIGAIACSLLLGPLSVTGQTNATYPRIEFGGGTGLTFLSGDLFENATSGVELSTYGSYHIGAGILLRATASLSAVGDAFVEHSNGDVDASGVAEQIGFDVLLLSVEPILRFSPPASLVSGHVGG